MKWELIAPQRGDMVRAKAGPLYHYGVYVSDEEVIQFGVSPVLRRGTPDREIDVCVTDIETFLCGEFLEVGVPQGGERKKRRDPETSVEAARARLGETGYHLLYNNCEHFAYECVMGEKYCSQTESVRQMFRALSSTDVYIAKIPDGKLGTVFPKERQEQIDQTAHEELKRQRCYVWKLLGYALERSYGLKMKKLSFSKDERGKWSCAECFFSLSHSGDAVAVAVSKKSVGVDIERLDRDMTERAAQRILTASETQRWQELPQERRQRFLVEAWSAKESLFKASGQAVFSPAQIETDSGVYTGQTVVDGTAYCFTVATPDVNNLKVFENVRL